MDFADVKSDDCMHAVTLDVANAVQARVKELYQGLYERSEALPDGLPNVVLAGLTLSWLECVYNVFGSASYESAVSLLKQIHPSEKGVRSGMRHAAHDFLRRSGWNRRTK
jgi:hypothetical protein